MMDELTESNLNLKLDNGFLNAYNPERIPGVGELDKLETFIGNKKNKTWIWKAVDHFRDEILGWAIGDHSANRFQRL